MRKNMDNEPSCKREGSNIFAKHVCPSFFIIKLYNKMIRVFVYGTLKKNEPNNHWLTKVENGFSTFIGKGMTKIKYPLVIATKYNIPFLLDSPENGNNVEGEIYEVDDKMLQNLDVLEDHPNFYERRQEMILHSDKEVLCWTYFLKKFKPDLLKKEMLKSYSSKGSHGLVYLDRYLRDPNYNYKDDLI